jgi:transcriptional regulator with XRE-family HTH domain
VQVIVARADEVGPILKKVRRAAKLRQEDVALTAGCSIKFLVDLEAGKGTAPLAKVFAVAHALGGRFILEFPGEGDDRARPCRRQGLGRSAGMKEATCSSPIRQIT